MVDRLSYLDRSIHLPDIFSIFIPEKGSHSRRQPWEHSDDFVVIFVHSVTTNRKYIYIIYTYTFIFEEKENCMLFLIRKRRLSNINTHTCVTISGSTTVPESTAVHTITSTTTAASTTTTGTTSRIAKLYLDA